MNNNIKLITNYADIKFHVDGIEIKFRIYHNLGNFIHPAIKAWQERTDIFTDKSFCRFVNNKEAGQIVITEADYIKLKNK